MTLKDIFSLLQVLKRKFQDIFIKFLKLNLLRCFHGMCLYILEFISVVYPYQVWVPYKYTGMSYSNSLSVHFQLYWVFMRVIRCFSLFVSQWCPMSVMPRCFYSHVYLGGIQTMWYLCPMWSTTYIRSSVYWGGISTDGRLN